jgi:hydrogenase nickel incorporation protein HypA/HybF
MHELGIASAVLDAVRSEAEKRPGARVTRIGVRVGDLAGVDRDALSFSFEVLVQGTEFEKSGLEIEACPIKYRCRACSETFVVADYVTLCPRCQLPDTECVGGTELELAYLEMEE